MKILKNNWPIIFLSLIVLGLGFSSLFLPWSLIDDGVDLGFSKRITTDIGALNFSDLKDVFWETAPGPGCCRFRPGFRFSKWSIYLLFNQNPAGHHLAQISILLLVTLLAFWITKEISGKKRAGILAGLLFSSNYLALENWYRLGTVEPFSLLLFALTFYFLLKSFFLIYQKKEDKKIKKNLLFSLIFLALFVFTKETNILIIGVFFVFFLTSFFLPNKFGRHSLKKFFGYFFFFSLILGVILLLAYLPIFKLIKTGSYTSNYDFSVNFFFDHFRRYFSLLFRYLWYFPLISLLTFILYWVWIFWNKRKLNGVFIFELSLIISFFAFFLPLLPWQFFVGRYLLPIIWISCVFIGIQIGRLLSFFKKWYWAAIIYLFFALTFVQNIILDVGFIRDYQEKEFLNSQMLTYLAKNTPQKGKILLNFNPGLATIEYFEEIKLHLGDIYNRSDLKVEYLDLEKKNFTKNDLILAGKINPRYTDLPIRTSLEKEFRSEFKTLIVTSPDGFLRRTGRGVVDFVFLGKRTFPEGIYTFYQGKYFWQIYKVI